MEVAIKTLFDPDLTPRIRKVRAKGCGGNLKTIPRFAPLRSGRIALSLPPFSHSPRFTFLPLHGFLTPLPPPAPRSTVF